ncbi:hypothetical protein DXG03_002226 [Asterophora parasitica]|uniref:Uncharacterized protein n=1 Tax=Asterophora parasitica TaxID=117018 RepID=A0A9P7GC44_9AGAR|nr:hypothetical protein DXG03_002226 [Asterophora parasitica]
MSRSRTRNASLSPQATPGPSDKIVTKRPLQDITDRFAIPAVNRLPTTAKPRRKVKVPSAAKLRAAKPHGLPSSLPPSSPPSTSSRLPIPDHHDHRSPSIAASDRENIGPQLENSEPAWSLGGDGDAAVDAVNTSDPFGFFAVEKKLKTLRAKERQPQYRAAPPPPISTMFALAIPPTPRKTHRKRRAVTSPNSDICSGADSMPSTPSPSKPINIKGNGFFVRDVRRTDGAMDETLETVLATPTIAGRRRPAKRACKEKNDMPPAKRRRLVRTAATTTRTTRGARSERENNETKRRATGAAASQTGPTTRSQTKGKGKSTASSAINDDQREARPNHVI